VVFSWIQEYQWIFGLECFAGYLLAIGLFVGFVPEDGRDMLLGNL
jgi:hypothetical protein